MGALWLCVLCAACQRGAVPSSDEVAPAAPEPVQQWDVNVPRGSILLQRLMSGATPGRQTPDSEEDRAALAVGGSDALHAEWWRGPLQLADGRWWVQVEGEDRARVTLFVHSGTGASRTVDPAGEAEGAWVDATVSGGVSLWWRGDGRAPGEDLRMTLLREDVVPAGSARRGGRDAALEAAAGNDARVPASTIPVTGALPEAGLFGGLRLRGSDVSATLEGRAGGTRDATALGQACVGWIGRVPDHLLVVESPVRVRLHATPDAEADLTLVLIGPAGQVYCRDDDDGLDPVFEGALVVGTWSVHVGTWRPESDAAYTLHVRSALD